MDRNADNEATLFGDSLHVQAAPKKGHLARSRVYDDKDLEQNRVRKPDVRNKSHSHANLDSGIMPKPLTSNVIDGIDPREWVYGKHYIRGFVTVTVAPGGIGKSSLALAETVAMATGKNLLGFECTPKTVLYWNGEDPLSETHRRIAAVLQKYSLGAVDYGNRILLEEKWQNDFLRPIRTNASEFPKQSYASVVAENLKNSGVDVLILDPLVALEQLNENDSGAMAAMMANLNEVARLANCAIDVLHHTRKVGVGQIGSNDTRGSSALVGAARSVRVLNRIGSNSPEYNMLQPNERKSIFRVEVDKSNMTKNGPLGLYRVETETLKYNGTNRADEVAVVTQWIPPSIAHNFSVEIAHAVISGLPEGPHRASPRADDWLGHKICNAMNVEDDAVDYFKLWIKQVFKDLIAEGRLVEVQFSAKNGNKVPGYLIAHPTTAHPT